MFDHGYRFLKLTSGVISNEYPLLGRTAYTFKTSKHRRYVVHVEEYENKVFVIKFCDSQHKNNKKRFSMILNDFDFPKIMRTIMEIAKSTLNKEAKASFAFVGIHKEKNGSKENKETINNQRYRIYKEVASRLFGRNTFFHDFDEEANCYLLVNKNNGNTEVLHRTIVKMFAEHFHELSHL